MKNAIIYILFTCLLAPMSFATYYEITTDTYTPGLTLQAGDSLYMTDGGFGDLNLLAQDITATIEGTSALVEGSGGIWYLNCSSNCHLELSGGQIHHLNMNNDATARLTGGYIQQIWSYQYTSSGPHITIVYSGDLPTFNETTDVLTGLWGSGDPFSIYLSDVPASTYGYSPAIHNIQFELIPEPTTLALLGLGSLLIRKKK